jgi:hypothetical protein
MQRNGGSYVMMRRLAVGLIAAGLLSVAVPATAQNCLGCDGGGTADPLGLIASGAVIPFVGAAGIQVVDSATGALTNTVMESGSLAILEVASPVGANSGQASATRSFHMFFFDQSCARVGPSISAPLTTNDSELININLISNLPGAGLIAAGGVDERFGSNGKLQPLSSPIHARVYWINLVAGTLSRVLEPISIHNPENGPSFFDETIWNPLRTGATFIAPLTGSGVRTTLFLVCPTQNIVPGVFPTLQVGSVSTTTTIAFNISADQVITVASTAGFPGADPTGNATINGQPFAYTGKDATHFTGVTYLGAGSGTISAGALVADSGTLGACPTGDETCFPALNPNPVPGTSATPLFLQVYNDEEIGKRNIHIFCRCWGAHPVALIDPIYSNADPQSGAPNGTYTEMQGDPACTDIDSGDSAHCSFTGYRSIQWGATAEHVGNDVFGRLSNGSWRNLNGIHDLSGGVDVGENGR